MNVLREQVLESHLVRLNSSFGPRCGVNEFRERTQESLGSSKLDIRSLSDVYEFREHGRESHWVPLNSTFGPLSGVNEFREHGRKSHWVPLDLTFGPLGA